MNITQKLSLERRWLLLALAAVFTIAVWLRLFVQFNAAFVSNLHYEEGTNYFAYAYYTNFWDSLFALDSGYPSPVARIMAWLVVGTFGIVDAAPAFLKLVTTLGVVGSCSLLLAERFRFLGPLPVRFLFVLTLAVHPSFDTTFIYNLGYALILFLVYFLLDDAADSSRRQRLAFAFKTGLAVLAVFSKPVSLALFPLFTGKAVQALKERRKFRLAGYSTVCLTMVGYGYILATSVAQHQVGVGVGRVPLHHLPLTIFRHWFVATGVGPFSMVIDNSMTAFLLHPHDVAAWMCLGIAMNLAWLKQLLRRDPATPRMAWLIPLVTIGGMYAVLTMGLSVPGKFWEVRNILQGQMYYLSRHSFLPLLFTTWAFLMLVRRYFPRATPALLAFQLGGLLLINLPLVIRPNWLYPSESLSAWTFDRPKLDQPVACVSVNSSPDNPLGKGCKMLKHARIATGPLKVPPELSPAGSVSLLLVDWGDWKTQTLRLPLVVRLGFTDGTTRVVTAERPPYYRYQTFSIPPDKSVESLAFEAFGLPPSRFFDLYVLGRAPNPLNRIARNRLQ